MGGFCLFCDGGPIVMLLRIVMVVGFVSNCRVWHELENERIRLIEFYSGVNLFLFGLQIID